MILTPDQLHIIQHSLGCDQYGRSTSRYPSDEPYYRNHYVSGPTPDLTALVTAGLMKDHGSQGDLTGGVNCYTVTAAGIAAMEAQSPRPPKLTRAQERYRQWQREDGSERFGEWLIRNEHNRKVDRLEGVMV